MNKILPVFFSMLFAVVLLSGCNSDDDDASTSSDGGTTTPASTESTGSAPQSGGTQPSQSVSQFAGTYVGSGTATASALGITETESAPVTIIIDEAGTVTIKSGADIFENVTVLNSNAFTYSQSLNGEDLGSVTCTGSLTINGSISNGVINGTLSSSNVKCNGIPVTVTGNLKANKQ